MFFTLSLKYSWFTVCYNVLVLVQSKVIQWSLFWCTSIYMYICKRVNHSVMSDSLWLHGLSPTGLLCPWSSLGKNTRVGSHSLLQETFLTQGSNPGLLNLRQILYHLSHQRSPYMYTYGWIYIYMLDLYIFFIFYSILGYYKILSIAPTVLYSKSLLVTYFIYSSMYIFISNS